jgi:hypothetical protein
VVLDKADERRFGLILGAITVGSTRESAAEAAGVTSKTLNNWLAKGDLADDEAEYAPEEVQKFIRFRREMLRREACVEQTLVTAVLTAALQTKKADWKAAAWLLERRFGSSWGYKQKLEHSGVDGGPIKSQTTSVSAFMTLAKDSSNYEAVHELPTVGERRLPHAGGSGIEAEEHVVERSERVLPRRAEPQDVEDASTGREERRRRITRAT